MNARLQDPRYFQIAVLAALVTFGIAGLDFGIRATHVAAILLTAFTTQFVGTRIARLPRFDPLSAMITSLSLILLLRTDVVALSALAGVLGIGSKFLLRVQGKHVFNPASFAIVTLVVASDRASIAAGQWGSAAIGALLVAGLGLLALRRARRAETTLAFLAAFALLTFARALWRGDPLTIPLHQLTNGALLVFAFFMISDPKTTPDAAAGRVLYGAFVALVAFAIRYVLFEPGAPILGLIVCSPLVPLVDRLLPGSAYGWRAAREPLLPESRSNLQGAPSCDSSFSSRA